MATHRKLVPVPVKLLRPLVALASDYCPIHR